MTTAGTVTRGTRRGEPRPPRRVLLLSDSAGLAAVLSRLLDDRDRLSRLGSLRELTEGRGLLAADAVVLDVPRDDRAATVEQLRRCYLGPLVVLITKGEDRSDLRPDHACKVLARPFSTDDLGAALAVAAPGAPATTAAPDRRASATPARSAFGASDGPPKPASTSASSTSAQAGVSPAARPAAATTSIDPKAAARQAPQHPTPTAAAPNSGIAGRIQRLLVAFTQGWQARRRIRVAGFSILAAISFSVAFALAAQGRCGPGCDALGTGFSPEPTVAPNGARVASSTTPKRAPGSSAIRDASSGPGAVGVAGAGVRLATTTTQRHETTTTRRPSPGGGGAGSSAPTTAPPTTPTTAPPTTPTTAPPTTPTTETTVPAPAPG